MVAKAELKRARLDLDYTKVEAPISGITDLEAQPVGSLVEPGDRLTTITQLDPIHVRFALPADDVERAARGVGDRQAKGRQEIREARLVLSGGEDYAHLGEVDFTDSSVDPKTGTILARAVFPNPDHALRPGRFVRVRLRVAHLNDALIVPERAIATSQQGDEVFVIGENGKAHRRPVELGPLVEEGRVIEEGLSAGERIVVNGLVSVRDGASVRAKPLTDDGTAEQAEDR